MFSAGISEIVLIVQDVDRATSFYRDVVGLTLRTQSEDWAWFWTGEEGSSSNLAVHKGRLLMQEHSPHGPEPKWGPIHYAFRVPRERLQAAVAHVRAHGVEVYGPVHFDWMEADSYYFYDPDGNLLEWWSPV